MRHPSFSLLPWLALVAMLVRCEPAYPAQLDGAVRYNSGTSGTNTTSGAVTVSARTNLNTGKLNATNSVVVGRSGEAGVLTLSSTNGSHSTSLSVLSDGTLTVTNDSTLAATIALASGYTGAGTKALYDDGTYKTVVPSSGANWTAVGTTNSSLTGTAYVDSLVVTNGIAGYTNININPTDTYLPYRSNATVFGDSGLYTSAVTNVALNGYHYFYGATGGNYERLTVKALPSSNGATYNTEAGGSGTYRNHTFQIGGTNRLEIWNDGTYLFNPQGTNGYIYLQGSSSSGSFYAQANGTIASVTAGTERIRLEPSASSAPFKFDSARAIGTAGFFTIKNLGTNIFSVSGVSGYVGTGALVLADDGTYKAPNTFASGTNYTILAVSSPAVAVATTDTNYWPLQQAITLKSVTARLLNPSTSGSVTLDLAKNGTTVLSAPVSLAAGATNSAASLSVTAVASGDVLVGYVTAAGANAAGATLVIGYTSP